MVCGTPVPCGTALTLEVGEPIGTALMLGCATLGCEVFETIWYPASDTSPPTMPAITKPRLIISPSSDAKGRPLRTALLNFERTREWTTPRLRPHPPLPGQSPVPWHRDRGPRTQ